jgi:hypothetical protein
MSKFLGARGLHGISGDRGLEPPAPPLDPSILLLNLHQLEKITKKMEFVW